MWIFKTPEVRLIAEPLSSSDHLAQWVECVYLLSEWNYWAAHRYERLIKQTPSIQIRSELSENMFA